MQTEDHALTVNISKYDWQKIFKLRDNFVEEVSGRELYDYQKKISNILIKDVLLNRGNTLVAEYTRQSGKTTVVTDTVVFLLLFYYQLCKKFRFPTMGFFNVGFFAPLKQQARTDFDIVREYMEKCKNMGFDYSYREFNAETIHLRAKSYPPRTVHCFTASPTTHPESKTLNLIIYEESQDLVDKQVDKAISPMGAHTNATEVFIGVAGYQRCKFWRLIEEQKNELKVIVPVEAALEERKQRYERTKNPIHLNYQKYVDKKKREIGENSDEYKTQYLLEWILERGQFITYEALMNLEAEYEVKEEYTRIERTYGGIDWGKMHDSTVFTVLDDKGNILAWYEWQGDDYDSQIEDIAYIIGRRFLGMQSVHCDSTGTQDVPVDILRAKLRRSRLNTKVIGVNFSSKKDEMYKNLSRLMLDTISKGQVVEKARIKFPKIDSQTSNPNIKDMTVEREKFVSQFLELQKDIKPTGRWDCKHPEGPQYHDDYTDSLGLACMAFRRINKYSPSIA